MPLCGAGAHGSSTAGNPIAQAAQSAMPRVRRSPRAVRRSPLAARRSPLAARRAPLAARRSPRAMNCGSGFTAQYYMTACYSAIKTFQCAELMQSNNMNCLTKIPIKKLV